MVRINLVNPADIQRAYDRRQVREWKQKHRDYCNAYNRIAYWNNRDEILARMRDRYALNGKRRLTPEQEAARIEYMRRYHHEHKGEAKALHRPRTLGDLLRCRKYMRRRVQDMRAKFFEMYGERCVRCGFDDLRALTLDHVRRNGAEERRKIGGQKGVLRRAIECHRPEEYRVLCENCQRITWIEGREECCQQN